MKQPVETALVSIVKAATPSLEKVPAEFRPELEAMEERSDAELWQAAESALSPDQQRQLARLLEKNQGGKATPRDTEALRRLRHEADRVMLRRSYAYLLLKYRGHRVPSMAELKR
jgi:hypothetical protein